VIFNPVIQAARVPYPDVLTIYDQAL